MRRFLSPLLGLLFVAAACSDNPTQPVAESPPPMATNSQGALTNSGTADVSVSGIPLSAPCLGLSTPLTIEGTWHIRFALNLTPRGHFHLNEHIDYSDTRVVTDGKTWEPVPGASEAIIFNLPGSEGSAAVARHEFHARYVSQNGLSDLLVSHRIKIVVEPDGEIRHLVIGIPFDGECVGGSR